MDKTFWTLSIYLIASDVALGDVVAEEVAQVNRSKLEKNIYIYIYINRIDMN